MEKEDKERYEKIIKIITAFLNGKKIEYRQTVEKDWSSITTPECLCYQNAELFRIKPEYRPCKNAKEFTRVISDHRYNLTIKNKRKSYYDLIVGYNDNGVELFISKQISYINLFNNFIFAVKYNNDDIIGIIEE